MMRVEAERFLVRAFFEDGYSICSPTEPGQSLQDTISDEEEFLAGKVPYFTIERYSTKGTAEVVYDSRRGLTCTP